MDINIRQTLKDRACCTGDPQRTKGKTEIGSPSRETKRKRRCARAAAAWKEAHGNGSQPARPEGGGTGRDREGQRERGGHAHSVPRIDLLGGFSRVITRDTTRLPTPSLVMGICHGRHPRVCMCVCGCVCSVCVWAYVWIEAGREEKKGWAKISA